MALNQEIKRFIKNTAVFTLVFAVLINFGWDYFSSLNKNSADAHNNATFESADIHYLGNTAAALSLRIGGAVSKTQYSNLGNVADNTISITEVLQNPTAGHQKLIEANMAAIMSYADILKMDIMAMLENASNRWTALDNHISLLKSYYLKTQDRLAIIKEQKQEIRALLSTTDSQETNAKATLQESYNQLEYSGIDGAIDAYLEAKNTSYRVKIYNIYLDRFDKSYQALQTKNRKILDAIINNRDGIIKKSVVVIPDTGTDIIKELGLIQSEAEYKAKNATK